MFNHQNILDGFAVYGPVAIDIPDDPGSKISPGYHLKKLASPYDGSTDFPDSMVGESFARGFFTIGSAISAAALWWNNILDPGENNGVVIVRKDTPSVVITVDTPNTLMDENAVCHLLIRQQHPAVDQLSPIKSVRRRHVREIMRPFPDTNYNRRWVELYKDPYDHVLRILCDLQPNFQALENIVSAMRADPKNRIDQWKEAQELSSQIVDQMRGFFVSHEESDLL